MPRGELPVFEQRLGGQFVKLHAAVGQERAVAVDQGQHGQQQRVDRQPRDAGVFVYCLQDAVNLLLGVAPNLFVAGVFGLEAFGGVAVSGGGTFRSDRVRGRAA